MKQKRFSAEQIVAVLKQAEAGLPLGELLRRVGVSEQTFYRWKKQYVGLEADHVRQLEQLQEENTRWKQVVADLTLDKAMLQAVLAKKFRRPSRRRQVVDCLQDRYRVSERGPAGLPGCTGQLSRIPAAGIRGRNCARGFERSYKSGCDTGIERSWCC